MRVLLAKSACPLVQIALNGLQHHVQIAGQIGERNRQLFSGIPADRRDLTGRDVTRADLPHEAREVLARIATGGPFPFDRDGIAFGNREQQLPSAPRGYYHEYTVPTPGVKTRGARRVICGGARQTPEVCYYTSDHYRTFRRIRE